MKHTNAKKRTLDGYKFASGAECERYLWLKTEAQAGRITGMEVHPRFSFTVNGHKVGRGYTADFRYVTLPGKVETVEDVKGRAFRDWPLRRDLFRACYPRVRFVIVRKVRGSFV